jgi:hypothetical protein
VFFVLLLNLAYLFYLLFFGPVALFYALYLFAVLGVLWVAELLVQQAVAPQEHFVVL